MNKFRVTCLLDDNERRVFATRKKFETREEAEAYAATVAESRKPLVGYCNLDSSYDYGHWTITDDRDYDGPGSDVYMAEGDRLDELDFMFEFCEETDRCTVFMDGVPCGSATKSPDEAGSGWLRCDGCGML